jgi:hypothetical protein
VTANIARCTFPAGSGPRGGEARSALLQSPTPQTWAPTGEGLGHDPGGYGLTMRAVRYEARARTLAHYASTTMSTPLWGNPAMPRHQVNRARGTPKSTTDGGRQLCMTGNGYAWDGRTQMSRLLQRRGWLRSEGIPWSGAQGHRSRSSEPKGAALSSNDEKPPGCCPSHLSRTAKRAGQTNTAIRRTRDFRVQANRRRGTTPAGDS